MSEHQTDHLALLPRAQTVTVNTPSCQGEARWDEAAQAEYVSGQLAAEFGTRWRVVPHDQHFHVVEAAS